MAIVIKVVKRTICSKCGEHFMHGEECIQEAERVNDVFTGRLLHYHKGGCPVKMEGF